MKRELLDSGKSLEVLKCSGLECGLRNMWLGASTLGLERFPRALRCEFKFPVVFILFKKVNVRFLTIS